VNIGIVGCGYIAETAHIPNALSIPRAKLIAVCDSDEEKAARIRERFNVPESYTQVHELLDKSEIDAVLVCTPTSSHASIAIEAANAGKHVFIEKPIALSSPEADRVIKAASRNGVNLMIGYQMRFLPNHLKVKELIKKGKIGITTYIEMHSETLQIKPEDGILIDYGSHFIDLACWYLEPDEVVEVACFTHSSPALSYQKETQASMIMRFRSGIIARVGVFWLPEFRSWEAVSRYVKVIGTQGWLFTEQASPTITLYRARSLLGRVNGPTQLMSPFAVHPKMPVSETTYRKELEEFIDSIQMNREPVVTGLQAKRVLEIIEGGKLSDRQGVRVEVPLVA
jgi:predicted dehydrogenase